MSRVYTAIDLFSGAGGLTVGIEDAGFIVLAAVELDPVAAESYRMNHIDKMMLECDIRDIDVENLMNELGLQKGELDLLAGCPPCQGFTTLRTKNRHASITDDRNDLVFEFLRFAEEMMPKAILLENVPNLAKDRRIMALITELESLGYLFGPESLNILDAQDFGVPQRRKRMILSLSRYGVVSKPKPIDKKATVRQAFQILGPPGSSSDPLHQKSTPRSSKVEEIIRAIPKDGGSRSQLPEHLQLDCHRRTSGFRDVYGRMAWDVPAPTMTSGCGNPSKGRYLHPEENRAITLREAAVLQGLEKDYKFSLKSGKGAVARMIGNAIPPAFAKQHAKEILDCLTRD